MTEDSDTKTGKNGKKEGVSGSSFFTWFMVIALLGVWTSVAVVWFDLVDYEEVLAKAKDFRYNLSEVLQGKLGIYDADGDGDFDVDDAKVLLGLIDRPVPARAKAEDESEEPGHPDVEFSLKSEDLEELEEIIHSSYAQDDVPSEPVDDKEDEVDDEFIKQAEQYLFGDLDNDGKEDVPSEVLPEEDDLQVEVEEEEEMQVETLTSNLQGAREEVVEEEQIDDDNADETESEDHHSHAEESEEDEPEPTEIPNAYDPEDEADEARDDEAQGEYESDQELEQEPLQEAEPETELELESELVLEPEPELELVLEPEPELDLEPEPELEYEQEDDPESLPEPEHQLETEAEHEPGPDFDAQEHEEQEDDDTADVQDSDAVPLPEPAHDEHIGTTEQNKEHISDKHPDEKDEKASPTEAHQDQPSDM